MTKGFPKGPETIWNFLYGAQYIGKTVGST